MEGLTKVFRQFFAPVEHLHNELEHFEISIASEKRLACDEFNKNTANGPDIDCVGVIG